MSTPIGTRIYTFFRARYVGRDEFGNRYFEHKRETLLGKKRRYVLYKGMAEPSKVPAHWHGWLHYTLDAPIPEAAHKYGWQKPHLPNLTGTVNRYVPSGHITKSGQRAKATSDYQPWSPQ